MRCRENHQHARRVVDAADRVGRSHRVEVVGRAFAESASEHRSCHGKLKKGDRQRIDVGKEREPRIRAANRNDKLFGVTGHDHNRRSLEAFVHLARQRAVVEPAMTVGDDIGSDISELAEVSDFGSAMRRQPEYRQGAEFQHTEQCFDVFHDVRQLQKHPVTGANTQAGQASGQGRAAPIEVGICQSCLCARGIAADHRFVVGMPCGPAAVMNPASVSSVQ